MCKKRLEIYFASKENPTSHRVFNCQNVIHYTSLSYFGKDSKAIFTFTDDSYIDNDAGFQVAEYFTVIVNVKTLRMIKYKLDKKSITASQALISLCFNTIGAQHVKIHVLAN